ncbi:MAG TPA: alpha/beta fold hydrolase [Acidimicrobiales bacterium]|nr:alpha/beta fold hydrolase [Acidimicrobiales bacterium]
MRWRLGVATLVAAVMSALTACSGSESGAAATTAGVTSTTAATAAARLVDRPCDTPASLGPTHCYYLRVPERRGVTHSRTIQLWVAVVTPANVAPSALPLVYLPGGPGGTASILAMDPSTAWPGGSRPIVYLDPRGTGRSRPDLSCPEVGRPLDASHPWAERRSAAAASFAACRDRLVREGIDLDGYNTVETAADVVALRQALGYDKWMLWGISYGGRVAQEVLRQDPDGVAALLLDSPLTSEAQGPAAKVENDKASTVTLSAACAAEPSCESVTPDLNAAIDAAIAHANAHPYTAHPRASDGSTVSVLITGQEVLQAKVFLMAGFGSIVVLPGAAKSIAAGDTALLDTIAAQITDPPRGPIALSGATVCADEQAGLTAADKAVADDPGDFGTLLVLSDWPYCDTWKVDSVAGGSLQAPKSDVPTLIFEGALDPILSPSLGAQIARTLTHSTIVTIPAGSHGNAMGTPCASSIAGGFLDDPQAPPDTSCVASLPPPFAP